MTVLLYDRKPVAASGSFTVTGIDATLFRPAGSLDPALSQPAALATSVWDANTVRVYWKRPYGATTGIGWRLWRSTDSTNGINGSWIDITGAANVEAWQPASSSGYYANKGSYFRATDSAAPSNGTVRTVWYRIEEKSAIGYSTPSAISDFLPVDSYTPVAPQATVDTTYALPSGAVHHCTTAAQLTAALVAFNPGDVITLAAGTTFDGTFTVPQKANPSNLWTYIMSDGTLPVAGTRIKPTDIAQLATLRAGSAGTSPLTIANHASYIRLVGLNLTFTSTINGSGYACVNIGDSSTLNAQSDLPHHITIDRCVLRPPSPPVPGSNPPPPYVTRGVCVNCYNDFALIDSWIDNIRDETSGDFGVGIGGWTGLGPMHIENNFIGANGTSFLWGGGGAFVYEGRITRDIKFLRNHCYKRTAWRGSASGGSYTGGSKNLFEFKWGRRWLIEGNVFENYWMGAQAYALALKVGQDFGGSTQMWWAMSQDVTLRNNVLKTSANGINTTSEPYLGAGATGDVTERLRRVKISNLAYDDVSASAMVPAGYTDGFWEVAAIFDGAAPWFTFDHIGCVSSTAPNPQLRMFGIDTPSFAGTGGLKITNSILPRGAYGLWGVAIAAEGTTALLYYTDEYTFQGNLIISPQAHNDLYGNSPHNAWPTSYAAVGFAASGYGLNQATSPYRAAVWGTHTTDGTDPGVDNTALQAAITGVREASP